jgi:hypothetical protein
LINFTPLLHFYFSDSAQIFGEGKRKQKVLNTSIGIASKGRRRRQQSNNDEENGSNDETSGGDETTKTILAAAKKPQWRAGGEEHKMEEAR